MSNMFQSTQRFSVEPAQQQRRDNCQQTDVDLNNSGFKLGFTHMYPTPLLDL